MNYKILGNTELEVSSIGLGTWQFGGEWGKDFSQKEADAIVGTAIDSGITLFDTAECYGVHHSERMLGKAVDKKRQQLVIATKFGHKYSGFSEREQAWSKEEVIEQLEDSLRALGTDYIDLYQFHSGTDEQFETPELWEALAQEVQKGSIRYLGISISASGDRKEQVRKASSVGARAIQLVYNRLERAPEKEIFPICQRQNLGILARVPLASGLLSGAYKPGATFGKQDIRSTAYMKKDIDEQLREVMEIQQNEVPQGVPMTQWALAWCLKNPLVTAVIPGAKNPEQVKSNAQAAEICHL